MDGGSSVFVLSQFAESIAVMLCDVAVKGVVVLVLAMVLTATMRRASAAARHLVWVLAVLSMLVLPVLSVCLPGWHVLPQWSGLRAEAIGSARWAPAAESASSVAERVTIADVDAAASRGAAKMALHLHEATSPELLPGTRSSGESDGWSVVSTAAWIAIVWAVGIVAALSPVVIGTLSLWRLQRVSRRLSGRVWMELLDRASAGLGLRRQVALLCSDDQSVPMAWGMLRPKVLLPGVAERWAEGRRSAVLLHELAHVKRWDCASHVAARLACALHWFNPLVWSAARHLLSESERACDDLVLGAGLDGPDYAQHLLEIASGLETQSLTAYASIAMARPSKLEGRLVAILDATRSRRGLTRLALVVSLAAAASVLVPLGVLRPRAEAQEAGKPTKAEQQPDDSQVEERAGTASEDRSYAFGPVVERFVNDDAAKENMCIDLDTGELHTPPADVKPNDFSLRAWLCRSGVDAGCETSKGVRGLVCFETAVTPVDAGAWDSLSPDQISRSLAGCRPPDNGEPSFMSAKDKIPATFKFKTREGGMGVLQIVDISDQRPRGVRVRLKRVQGIAPVARHWIYPLMSKDDGQKLRFLWWVKRGRPARLIHGWYTLVDGRIHEHAGFGTSRQADAGPIELGFETGVEGGKLVMTATRTEALADGSKTAGTTGRTSIPENTRVHTSHLLQATELTDHHLTLWQAQWARDGKAVKTITYAVRLVEPDDPAAGFEPPEASQKPAPPDRRPAELGDDAGEGLRKRKSVLFTQGWRALQEERFKDAYEIAGRILSLDPEDQSAKILRDRAAKEKRIRKLGDMASGKAAWDDIISRRQGIVSGPARVREKLKKRISLDLKDTPVSEIVAFLSDVSGINMKLDPNAIEDEGPLISLKVEDMPLENALDNILRRFAGLDYVILDDEILISTKAGLVKCEVRTYDVHDLLMANADEQHGDAAEHGGMAADLVARIKTIVRPGTWKYAGVSIRGEERVQLATTGADKDATGVIVCRDYELIVKQTVAVHVEIARVINSLRESRAKKAKRRTRPAELAPERQHEKGVQLRRRKSMLFTQGWEALRAGRLDDAMAIAGQILDLDPEDESAEILIARVRQQGALRGGHKEAGDSRPEAKKTKQAETRRQLPIVVPGGEATESPPVRRIREKLKTKVSLDFADTPITDVIAYLHDVSGVNMMLDPDAIGDEQPKITLRLADISLKTALDLVVRRMAKLDYVVQQESIFISTGEDLATYELRTYDVRGLLVHFRDLKSGAQFSGSASDDGGESDLTPRAVALLTLISTTIEPQSWKRLFVSGRGARHDVELQAVGKGTRARGRIVYREGDLIVFQTPKVHLEISRLLTSIRAATSVQIMLECSRFPLLDDGARRTTFCVVGAATLYRNVFAEGRVAVLSGRSLKILISDQDVATEALPRLRLANGQATLMPLGSDIPFALLVKPSIMTDRRSVVIEWALAPAPEGEGTGSESAGADHRDLLARTVVPHRGSLLILWSKLPGGAKAQREGWGVRLTPTVTIQEEEEVRAP